MYSATTKQKGAKILFAPLCTFKVRSGALQADIFPDEGVKRVQKAVFEHFSREFQLPHLLERSACHKNVAKRCKQGVCTLLQLICVAGALAVGAS